MLFIYLFSFTLNYQYLNIKTAKYCFYIFQCNYFMFKILIIFITIILIIIYQIKILHNQYFFIMI